MDFLLAHIVFNLSILIRCETLPHTCIPIISFSSVNLFHMVVFLLSEIHFHSTSIQWSLLELNHGYPYPPKHNNALATHHARVLLPSVTNWIMDFGAIHHITCDLD